MKGWFGNRARRGTEARKRVLATRPRRSRDALRSYWSGLSPTARKFLVNALIGTLVELAIVRAFLYPCFPDQVDWLQDIGADAINRFEAVAGHAAPPSRPLVFIDVDERTWESPRWGGGEPLEAPRDGLLALLDFGSALGARTLVMDVLVDRRATRPADADFAAALLARQAASAASAPASMPARLVLVRDTTTASGEPGDGAPAAAALPELGPTPLDPLVSTSAGQVVEAAPLYAQSAIDRELRDWSLWQVVCRRDAATPAGRAGVLPSVQVVALAADARLPSGAVAPWRRTDGPACPDAGDAAGLERVRQAFDEQMTAWLAPLPMFQGLATEKSNGKTRFANRIVFRTADATTALGRRIDNRDVVRLSALDVLERPQLVRRTLSDDEWARAIVVVGQSHRAAHDSYLTPLGDMPGALVVLNSVDSLSHVGVLTENPMLDVIATAISILLSAWVVAKFKRPVHGFIVSTAVAVVLGLGCIALVGHGVWVDFMLPLLSILVVETIEHVKHWIKE